MSAERVEIASALRSVIADLTAHLESARSIGILDEPRDAPRPDPTPALASTSEAPIPTRVAHPVSAPTRSSSTPWASVAEAARTQAALTARGPDGPNALGAAGLASVAADLDGCTRCGLCKARNHIVVGVGEPEADLMVIGGSPEEPDDLRGEPFVGPAGEMLDKMLDNVLGLDRSRVYITSVVKCRSPGTRSPTPHEIATCIPFLHRQIRAVLPKLLLVLGGLAAQHLLGVRSIDRERGHEGVWESIPAIPTLHPSYLLQVPDDKRKVFQDLQHVRRRYDALGGRR